MSEKAKEEKVVKKSQKKDTKKAIEEPKLRFKKSVMENTYHCLCCGNTEIVKEHPEEDWSLTECEKCGILLMLDKKKSSIKEGRSYKGEYLVSKLDKFFRPASYAECAVWFSFFYGRSVIFHHIKIDDISKNVRESMIKHCKFVRDKIKNGVSEEELNKILEPAEMYAERETLKIKKEYENIKKAKVKQ